jgi:F420-dependent oxidoreductase-like protein
MKIGINGSGLLAKPALGTLTADITSAEADGLESYWLAQTGGIDALTVFAAHGDTGSAMTLGTAVIPTWVVHPQALAGQALTTNAAVGGRLVLGLGLAHEPSVTGRWKMKWERPVRQMLDFLDVLQPLLAEGSVSHDGYFWSYEGQIPLLEGSRPKVMLAALGEQMLRIAGARTDGTILWCVGPKTVAEHIAPTINAAAEKAGRDQPAIVCSLPVWVTDDPAPAREFIAKALSIYAELPSYRAMLDVEGLHGLGELSLVGSEDEVAEGIAAVAASGATDFTAVPMGANPDEIARTRDVLRNA